MRPFRSKDYFSFPPTILDNNIILCHAQMISDDDDLPSTRPGSVNEELPETEPEDNDELPETEPESGIL